MEGWWDEIKEMRHEKGRRISKEREMPGSFT